MPALELVIGGKYYEYGESERNEENICDFIDNPEQYSDAEDISKSN